MALKQPSHSKFGLEAIKEHGMGLFCDEHGNVQLT